MTEVASDTGKATFVACFELADKRFKSEFKNSESGWRLFEKWLRKHGVKDVHLFFESTGRYGDDLAAWAFERGWNVTALNPLRTRRFAQAQGIYNKTDSVDSESILDFAKSSKGNGIRLWRPWSKSERELKDIYMELVGLQKMIIQESNRLESRIKSDIVKQSILTNIQNLEEVKDRLELEALRVIKGDPKLKGAYIALRSMKGIGDKTAIAILAKVDFDAFKKGRQIVAFAGLAPRKWESGTSVRKKEMISRVGHADLRAALYMPAIVAMTHDPEMKAFKLKLEAKGKPKKVIICAVMARLLRVAFAKVRDSKIVSLKAAA